MMMIGSGSDKDNALNPKTFKCSPLVPSLPHHLLPTAMAVAIIPVALSISVIALVLYVTLTDPKRLIHLKSWRYSNQLTNSQSRPDTKEESGPNKDRKWGSTSPLRFETRWLTM